METRVTDPVSDRRLHYRLTALIEHGVSEARVRPAHAAALIDISPGGVLIDTSHRLMPGVRIELHLRTTGGIQIVRGCVIRCSVVRLRADAITYRGAVSFDRFALWLPAREYSVPEAKNRSNSPPWATVTR